MKFTKYLFLAACSMAMVLGGYAQNIGLYSPGNIQSGGTIVVPANSTNVFWTYALTNGVQNGVITTNTFSQPSITPASNTNLLLQNVASFEYIGLTWSYASGSNATCNAFKSYDYGNTFEATPTFSFTGPAAASTAFLTNVMADVRGVTTLSFVIKNASTIPLTNHISEVNLKANTIQVVPAGISAGTTPGAPIHVTGFN
jgi:hypothetical protein